MTNSFKWKRLIFSLLLAGEIAVVADAVYALAFDPMPMTAFLLLFGAGFVALFFVNRISLRKIVRIFLSLLLTVIIFLGLTAAQLVIYAKVTEYEQLDEGKAEVFADREVMIFAPHQDDELSMLSGTLNEYLRYGSNVRIVFVTNGDYLGLAQTRVDEALDVANFLGIPEENIIFLGYGDSWNIEGGIHIYNAAADQVVQSVIGRTETYGYERHPAWTQGKAYTRQNMYEDIRDVILKYKPDVIFNMAFEPHGDHRATALFVEEAMAEILRMDEDYAPLLLESVSYHTSYYGADDFYNENILSIPNPFDSEYDPDINIYAWADRVRLPVDAGTLSRALLGSDVYKALSLHGTQGCNLRAGSIISGDTVFWHRDTSSLSYTADITVSSGEGAHLNNFKLIDSSNINDIIPPFEDLWLPTDTEKTATVSFDSPVDISEIRLYDNPSLEDNVLKAKIIFDDGSWLKTDELKINGSGTSVEVNKRGVASFAVQLLETEGDRAGLTEIEVYKAQKDYGLNFVKIQNENGDFVYDYYINRRGVEYFELYTAGDAPADLGDYTITYSSKSNAFAEYENGKILVSCPIGTSCTVTVSSPDSRFSDTVHISNPGNYKRHIGSSIESFLMDRFYYSIRVNNSFNIARDAYYLVRYGRLYD